MAREKKSLYEKIIPLGIPLAWLQLASESKRFAVALAGITFAVAMMLFQMGLQKALYKQVVGPLLLLDGQVMVVGSHYEYFGVGRGFANVRLHQVLGNPDVIEANSIKLGCASFKNVEDGRERDIFLIAFDPSKKVFVSSDITSQQELLKNRGAVLFDSLAAAKARGVDVVLCDTAGRLHNKVNLMNELSKLRKIIDRELPDAAKETLLVLDATTGQNGLQQAKVFRETAGLTGIILTKLDGTAKGGICVAIAQELGVPVKFVGLGEGIDDLQPFNAEEYVKALI